MIWLLGLKEKQWQLSWMSLKFSVVFQVCKVPLMVHKMSQPHFWKSVRTTFTPPKWGLRSPPGLPKLQSSNAGVKTPRLETFFMSLENYWSVDVENGLHEPFGHLQHKSWQKKGLGVKLAVWLLTTKSWESTRPRCVQMECNTPLESFQQELQVCFRPHPNPRFEQKVMNSQSLGNPNRDSFGTPPWESWDKKPFGCGCRGVT
jgi:hypothetical protein